ncbi:MAG: DUF4294 domain-containing protein [Prolixibacteraceae bacterium]|nr:DUF4294 domain-containing protein [Prolixibacteraceae bacterium]
MTKIYLSLFFLLLSGMMMGQEKINEREIGISSYQSSQNDSIVFRKLEQVDVYPRKGRNLNYRRYTRIVARIRKVYPFAKSAALELEKYNELYENSSSDRERRKYVRKVEKELFAKHEAELKRFTISEGQYLMLLIDRETGTQSYSIIKELKGGVAAVFWQGISKIFNNDLKKKYDPVYHHYMIEQIVLMIEMENAEAQKKK